MSFGPGLVFAVIAALGPQDDDRPLAVSSWDVPLECPGRVWLDGRVGAYLGRAPNEDSELMFVAQVIASGSTFELELETVIAGVRERHHLSHHDCAALTELAASVLAITIDPLALGDSWTREAAPVPLTPVDPKRARAVATQGPQRQGQRAPEPALVDPAEASAAPSAAALLEAGEPALREIGETSEPAASEPDLVSSMLPSDLPDPRPLDPSARDPRALDPRLDAAKRTRLVVGANAGLAVGLFPAVAPAVHGAIGLQRGPAKLEPGARTSLRAELAGGTAPAGRFRSADGSAGGDLLAWDLALRACAVPRWGRFELRACAALGAGQIRARGVGVDTVITRAHPWVWIQPELGAAVELGGRLALFIDLGPGFNLSRPTFSIANPSATYLTPVVSGHGRAGVELRFF